MANTIPANNNTGLYNNTGAPIPTSGNVVGGNILASGYISAAGNIYTAGFYFGDGSQLTNLPSGNSNYSNANVAAYLPIYSGVVAAGSVSATGNISGNYIIGNGSLLTGVVTSSYGNSNVTTLLAGFGSNTVSTSGNITGGYILGNGSQLTGLPATYGNSNVSTYLASGTNTANIVTTANVQGGNLKTSGAGGNIVGANYISGNFFVGDGSQLTNVTATSSYSNSNVTSLMASFGSNVVSTTGNISGGYFVGNGSQLTGIATSSYANANAVAYGQAGWAGNIIPSGNGIYSLGNSTNYWSNAWFKANTIYIGGVPLGTTGNTLTVAGGNVITSNGNSSISTTGNVAATYFVGDGSLLTGNVGNAAFANVANNVSVSNAQSGSSAVYKIPFLDGTAVPGNTQMLVDDVGPGLYFTPSTGTLGAGVLSASGNITGAYYFGNGSQLTGITATSTYGNSNVTNLLSGGTYSGDIQALSGVVTAAAINSTGALSASSYVQSANGVYSIGSFGGTYSDGIVVDYVTGNGRISVGGGDGIIIYNGGVANTALVNITSTGAVSVVGNITGNYFVGNGSQLTGVTAAAGGSNTQLIYNNAGSQAGNAAMTFNNTTGNITLGNLVSTTANSGPQLVTPFSNGGMNPANVGVIAPDTGRITFGTGYNGNLANTAGYYTPYSTGTSGAPGLASRIFITDNSNVVANVRGGGLHVLNYLNLTSNITSTNNNTRYQGFFHGAVIGGGTNANTWGIGANATNGLYSAQYNIQVGGSTSGNLTSLGNTTVGYSVGINTQTAAALGSNIGNAVAVVGNITMNQSGTTYGNITNAAIYLSSFAGSQSNANVVQTTTAVGFYHPGPSTATNLIPGYPMGNIARQATNYYAFYNEDNLAQVRLGSVREEHYYSYGLTPTTGSVTIDKSNGQWQYVNPTGNITSVAFSNFITATTRPNTSIQNSVDTVTLIVQQGATGYTVTLPTGTGYYYANNNSTVSTTANTVTQVQIQAFYGTAANPSYMITVSPAFQ